MRNCLLTFLLASIFVAPLPAVDVEVVDPGEPVYFDPCFVVCSRFLGDPAAFDACRHGCWNSPF